MQSCIWRHLTVGMRCVNEIVSCWQHLLDFPPRQPGALELESAELRFEPFAKCRQVPLRCVESFVL